MKRCSGEEDAIYFIWLLLPLSSSPTLGYWRRRERRKQRRQREQRK
jgi:hypothetical protein